MQHAARLSERVAALVTAIGLVACSPAAPDDGRSPDGSVGATEQGSPPAPAPASPAPGEAAWTPMEDAPLARLEMATAAHGGRIWMAGGLSPLGEAVSEVEILDPASGAWTSGPDLPTGLHHSALVSDGERLWLIGGYVGASFSAPTDIVLVLEDGADAWAEGAPLPAARAAGAAAWDGTRIVYGGGVGPGGVAADVFVTDGDGWTDLGAMPRPREHLAAASDGEGRTWLLGGRVGGLDANLPDVALVDGATISPLDPLPTARGGVAAFYLPTLGACLTGGEAPTEAFTAVECVADDGEVRTLRPMGVARHGHGAAVVDGRAYVLMGGPTPGLSAHRSVERLDLPS